MQTAADTSILQTEDERRQEIINPNDRREKIHRTPPGHRQPERKLIELVQDGIFEIDERGQIWRLKKKLGCRWHGTKLINVKRQRAENRTPSGYLQVRAMMNGQRIYTLAHRLVWQHIYGDIPDGMVTNHKNGIKDDNRPENLEIVTYSENMKHAHKHGLVNQWGERNPHAKLSNNDVVQIRKIYTSGKVTQKNIAEKFGVSHQIISKIVRGKRRSKQGGQITSGDNRSLVYLGLERDPKSGRFIGKKATGRLLDGREWSEMPDA